MEVVKMSGQARAITTPEGFRFGPISVERQQAYKGGSVALRLETSAERYIVIADTDGGFRLFNRGQELLLVPKEVDRRLRDEPTDPDRRVT
jgi:hypothetical protein